MHGVPEFPVVQHLVADLGEPVPGGAGPEVGETALGTGLHQSAQRGQRQVAAARGAARTPAPRSAATWRWPRGGDWCSLVPRAVAPTSGPAPPGTGSPRSATRCWTTGNSGTPCTCLLYTSPSPRDGLL